MHFTVSIYLIFSIHSFVKSDLSCFHIVANTNMPENMRVQVSLWEPYSCPPDKNPDIEWGNQTVALILIFEIPPYFSQGLHKLHFQSAPGLPFLHSLKGTCLLFFVFFLNNTHHDRESYNRKLFPLPLMLFLSRILIGHTLKSPTCIVLILGLFLKYFTFGE